MIIRSIGIIIAVLLATVAGQQSPCPLTFYYESDDVAATTHGVVVIENPPSFGAVMKLELHLSIAAHLATNYVGKIELYDKSTIMDAIGRGMPVKYRVNFPLMRPLPVIVAVIFNGNTVCTGPAESGRAVTSITLHHTFSSGYGPQPQRQTPPQQPTPPSVDVSANPFLDYVFNRRTGAVNVNNNNSDNLNINDNTLFDIQPTPAAASLGCGVASDSIPLIVGGRGTSRGKWPWLAAIYRKRPRWTFICGGSLISNRLVITAAHCVTDENRNALDPALIMVRLGAFNISNTKEANALNKRVGDIRVKDFFRTYMLENDIAALVMSKTVTFNEYVRPVCLWSGSDDQEEVKGRSGTVVGWGRYAENALLSPLPQSLEVPIVSTLECRGSNSKFFGLTSATTLCAGARTGVGPCNGDSGGGLYLRRDSRWTLRGVVSNALTTEDNRCDLAEYVIYTDAAKYRDWIEEAM